MSNPAPSTLSLFGLPLMLWGVTKSFISPVYKTLVGSISKIAPSFHTWVHNKELFIDQEVIRKFLDLPEVRNCHYPFLATRNIANFDTVATKLYGTPRTWIAGALIRQNELLPYFCLLNIIVCANIHVTTHNSNISQDQGYVLYCIDRHLPKDLPEMIVSKMIGVFEGRKSLGLPYRCLLNWFLTSLGVLTFDDDEFASLIKPVTKLTVSQSQAHVKGGSSGAGTSNAGDDLLAEKAEIDAVAAGAVEMRPRSFHGKLRQFKQSITHCLDQMDARLDAFNGRLDQ
ncbi:hypothetical protein ACSBR1_016573 [Camellia fascicularis]